MIDLIKVKDKAAGNLKAHDILKDIVNTQTLLALSGGTSPDYRKMIVEPADILPGAVCVVDERWTDDIESRNEQLMRKSGLINFLATKGIGFHNIQRQGDVISDECDYDELIVKLFAEFPKKVGVMGIGINLHTAGIFPYSAAAKAPDFVVAETVSDEFPQRVTLTLRALGEFTNFVILMFGEEKRDALKIILDDFENDMQKYPAIFYRKGFAKSWLVTDIA